MSNRALRAEAFSAWQQKEIVLATARLRHLKLQQQEREAGEEYEKAFRARDAAYEAYLVHRESEPEGETNV